MYEVNYRQEHKNVKIKPYEQALHWKSQNLNFGQKKNFFFNICFNDRIKLQRKFPAALETCKI